MNFGIYMYIYAADRVLIIGTIYYDCIFHILIVRYNPATSGFFSYEKLVNCA